MLKCVLVMNNHGKPRLCRFYDQTPHERQQQLMTHVYNAISRRVAAEQTHCCIIKDADVQPLKIVYRHFATLYFAFIVDDYESELGILDLIHVFVQVLDACFSNVCELDLIYHFDKVNYILDEIVMGGSVIETNVDSILENIAAVNKLVQSEDSFFG